jgi:hypothetical protein
MKMLLKSEGFLHYEKLTNLTNEFINTFIKQKNETLYGVEAANSEYVEISTERLVLRDLRTAVRFSILLRDQEWDGYLEKVFNRQQ